jgi:cytochrome o ubiquinol oxidase subunit 2
MSKKYKLIGSILLAISIVLTGLAFLWNSDIAVLHPEGAIALKQRNLILVASLMSLLVVIPVFFLTFWIAWKYREGNKKAKYNPTWDGHRGLELTWWAIPCALIAVLGVITWQSTHALDPYKPLESTTKPVEIEVIALPWKWLFIYPEHQIATVNYVQFPEDTPLNFKITADAPMNSFWIPKLGGQVYAMAGMTTKLHLMADKPGSYEGSSANLSGDGFAGMRFTATSTTKVDFDSWVTSVQRADNKLDMKAYNELARPSHDNEPTSYISKEQKLYDTVVMKYMMPGNEHESGHTASPNGGEHTSHH